MINEFIKLFVVREYRKKWLRYIRQALYLVPIVALVLMFASTQNIKYYNQLLFLENSNYKSLNVSDVNEEGADTLKTCDVSIVISEETRTGAHYYKRNYNGTVFNLYGMNSNLENTYFTRKNMGNVDVESLRDNEAIISYDVAKHLKIKTNDSFYIVDNDDTLHEIIVKKVMKTKYGFGRIGSSGTILVNSKSIDKNVDVEKNYYNFYSNSTGTIKKQTEINECNFLSLSAKSVIMVNVVFPIMGILLIFVLLNREIKRVVNSISYDLAVFISMGGNKKEIKWIIVLLEGIVCVFSALLAVLLYKYALLQGYVGEYVPFEICIAYFAILVIVAFLIISVNTNGLIKRLEYSGIMSKLTNREA